MSQFRPEHPDPASVETSGKSDPTYAVGPVATVAADEVGGPTLATLPPEDAPDGPTDLSLSSSLGRYRPMELLGSGGMGAVWRVWDPSLRREVALKIMDRVPQTHSKRLARFLAEAQATAQLQHPGVLPVYDHGTLEDGRPFYTMKVIEGRTLADVNSALHARTEPAQWGVASDGMTFLDGMGILLAVSEAVAYAHSRGVVHRDIKPANIMVGHYGEVLLVDWGLVKILGEQTDTEESLPVETDQSLSPDLATRFGAVAGTLGFMSPEQADGRTDLVDARSDVYALGAVLWYILTGRVPRQQESLADDLAALPRLDPVLCEICLEAMDVAPAKRPVDGSAFAEKLGQWVRGARAEAQAEAMVAQAEQALLRLTLAERQRARIWCLRVVDPEGKVGTVPVDAGQESSLVPLLESGLLVRDMDGVTLTDPDLVDSWARLHGWMVEHGRLHRELHALASAAREWERSERPARLLWVDAGVAARSVATAELQGESERSFVRAGAALMRRKRRRLRGLSALITGVLAVSTAVSVVQWLDAVDARNDEAQARVEAEARSLLQQGHRSLAEGQPYAAAGLFRAADRTLGRENGSDLASVSAGLGAIRVYPKHSGDVVATAWSSDGGFVASGGFDDAVHIWRAATGETEHVLEHDSGLREVVWSPDGRHLATSTRTGSSYIWSAATGALLHTLPTDTGWSSALRFLHDGRVLAADKSGRISLIDPVTGVTSQTLEGHTHYVFASDQTPDGRWLATASVDQTVRIWDLTDGSVRQVLKHPVQLLYVNITADGSRVAAAGTLDTRVWLWDVESGAQIASMQPAQEYISGLDSSPDGSVLVTSGQQRVVHLWSAETGAHLWQSQRFEGDRVLDVKFSPDGSTIAVATSMEAVVFLDPRTGTILGRQLASGGSDSSLSWSPDSTTVATGHTNGSAVIRTLPQKPRRATAPCGSGGLVESDLSPNQQWLALALTRGGTCVVSLEDDEMVMHPAGVVPAMGWGPMGRRLASWVTAADDRYVRVWDRQKRMEREYFSDENTVGEASISTDSNEIRMATKEAGLLRASLDSGEILARVPIEGLALETQYHGDVVLITFHDRTAEVWDAVRGVRLARHERVDVSHPARAIDPGGRFAVWEEPPRTLRKVPLDDGTGWSVPIPAEPASIHVDGAGRWIITTDGDQNLRVFAAKTGVEVLTVPIGSAQVSHSFSPSGDRLATVTGAGEVQIRRVRDGAVLRSIQLDRGAEIYRAYMLSEGSLMTVSKDHVSRFWSIPDAPTDPGVSSNLRPCRDGRVLSVVPWPDPKTVWAPESDCAAL